MNYMKSEKGAMLVFELVILAAVLLVAGFAGYQYMKNAKAVNKAITSAPHVVAKTSPSPSSTATPKPANELDITELGIKMTLPTALTGLTYTIDPDHTGTADNKTYTVNTARFTTQYLQQNGCYTPAGVIGIGSISQYAQNPKTLGITFDVGPIRQVGNSWYMFNGSQAECGSNATVNSNQAQMMQLLSQAFNSASPL